MSFGELVDPQLHSPLVQLPVELRRHIYAYIIPKQVHVYLDRGAICVATCITPQPGEDYFCFDRRTTGDPTTEVWARRLHSPWGWHWRCEEAAKRLDIDALSIKAQHDSIKSLMDSCRKTREDIACLLAETSVISVDDIATLDSLLRGDGGQTNTGRRLVKSFSCAKRLSLSFRLPPPAYKDIENASLRAKEELPLSNAFCLTTSWSRLWHDITALPHLQTVDITLDHDSESSWSIIDENAILSTLQPLTSRPGVGTTIHMPTVPPFDAQETSYTFPVQRFTRQRLFPEYHKDGSIGVVYEEDAYKGYHTANPNSAATVRAAELTMHVWFQGVDLDYVAMDEYLDSTCYE